MSNHERIKRIEECHLFVAVRRTKENPNFSPQCLRTVIRDYDKDLETLRKRCLLAGGVWRIYKTVNKRDTEKAYKHLMVKLINTPEEIEWRVDSVWRTCLLQRDCRLEKNIMLDLDDKTKKGELKEILEKNEIPILQIVKTPNGWHFVIEHSDTRVLPEWVEIKRDGYVFIKRVGK